MAAQATSCAIVVCTRCRDPLSGARAAEILLSELQASGAPDGFIVEAVACMAGCDRPLAVAFRANGKASYLFGDISAKSDVPALQEFGALYSSIPDGWCSEAQRPPALRGKTIARIPANRREQS
jgi:predicted metal-binding protein